MGQTIEIVKTTAVDRVLVIDTDRSLTGQNGEPFNGVEAARRGTTPSAALAVRLFEGDSSVDHVYVMSNTVTLRRIGGWDAESIETATTIVAGFFRFYA